ncbi:Histidine kinase-like ATPase domain-containing protein [Micromonospora mirobrigensis]|uniref:Histidine kinase-like ATPase domain-containing protein n=1 Tax=Micromonospora mirobrigensis TaxID=262898 RepID=A0A1C5ACN6_9ACTN|nr:Histidine kinase-like ATPase domain-containing protein [Micromonospora mirobrigensis]
MSTGAVERSWCVVVPHHGTGARLARHRLADELADLVPPALLADLVAVLAELVGNAVRHAEPLPGGVVRVAWRLRSGPTGPGVQLRVTDGGAGAGPRMRTASPDAIDGRGLHIVSGLASRWGVDRDGLGQSVWAEFDPTGTPRPDLVATG